MGASLSTEAVVATQDSLVLLVCAELDGSVGHHTHHGGRVPAPKAEEALVEVGEVEQPEGLLEGGQVNTYACPFLSCSVNALLYFAQPCAWGLPYPLHSLPT